MLDASPETSIVCVSVASESNPPPKQLLPCDAGCGELALKVVAHVRTSASVVLIHPLGDTFGLPELPTSASAPGFTIKLFAGSTPARAERGGVVSRSNPAASATRGRAKARVVIGAVMYPLLPGLA